MRLLRWPQTLTTFWTHYILAAGKNVLFSAQDLTAELGDEAVCKVVSGPEAYRLASLACKGDPLSIEE